MKSFNTKFDSSASAYWAGSTIGYAPQLKGGSGGRKAFCPSAGWLGWGYVAMLRELQVNDMAQA